MATGYTANQSPTQLRNLTHRQIRQRAVQRAFEPGGTGFSSSDRRGLFNAPNSLQNIVAKTRLQHDIASSSVDLRNLSGLQFAHVTQNPGYVHGNNAEYYDRSQALVTNTRGKDFSDPAQSARQGRTNIHELGHHVEKMTTGRVELGGETEGMAENYADRHARGRVIRHMGIGVEYRPRAVYDPYAARGDNSVFRAPWDSSGAISRQVYNQTRWSGLQPGGR